MAEFVEVMREWRRMCDVESKNETCESCPLKDDNACISIWEADMNTLHDLEDKIEAWSREHPKTDTIREALKLCLRDAHCHGLCPYSNKDNCRNRLLTDVLKVLGDVG